MFRRYGEAEEMARMSLEAREFQCGAESLPAAASLAALAAVLAATQRATDAEALVRRCLKIRHANTVLSPLWFFFFTLVHVCT